MKPFDKIPINVNSSVLRAGNAYPVLDVIFAKAAKGEINFFDKI